MTIDKLCPFKKKKIMDATPFSSGPIYKKTTEEFMPCDKERCMAYLPDNNICCCFLREGKNYGK